MRRLFLALIALAAACTPLEGEDFSHIRAECASQLGDAKALPIEKCSYQRIKDEADTSARGIKAEGAFELMMAKRMEIAMKLDLGKITKDQAEIETMKANGEYANAVDLDRTSRRQQGLNMMLGGAAMQQAAQPAPRMVTCTHNGSMTNCF